MRESWIYEAGCVDEIDDISLIGLNFNLFLGVLPVVGFVMLLTRLSVGGGLFDYFVIFVFY
jgi:hypothetical protein